MPYLLYARLRTEEPVGVVTRYADVVTVLQSFSAQCAPAPQRLNSMGLSTMDRIGQIMVLQHPFMGPPDHTRLRAVCSQAFAPHRVERLRTHIQEIVDSLQEPHLPLGQIELMADLANPPATLFHVFSMPAVLAASVRTMEFRAPRCCHEAME